MQLFSENTIAYPQDSNLFYPAFKLYADKMIVPANSWFDSWYPQIMFTNKTTQIMSYNESVKN